MKCEVCSKDHDGSYGSGRFCSFNCKQKYIANKRGKSHVCRFCSKEFETSYKLGAHARNCRANPNARLRQKKSIQAQKEKYNIENPVIRVKLNCINCGNEYELDVRQKQFGNGDYKRCCSSLCAHSYASKFADPKKISRGLKKSELAKLANEKQRITYKCQNCGASFTHLSKVNKKFVPTEHREITLMEFKASVGDSNVAGKPGRGSEKITPFKV